MFKCSLACRLSHPRSVSKFVATLIQQAAAATINNQFTITQPDDAHTMACAAHSARSSLAEMDGGTIMSGHDQLVLAACQVAPDKGIVLVQRNGVQAALADVAELACA